VATNGEEVEKIRRERKVLFRVGENEKSADDRKAWVILQPYNCILLYGP